MATVEMSREYPVDTEQLYRHLTDPVNWPSFYNNMVAAEPARFTAVGDTATATYRILGIASEIRAEIVEASPGERIRFVARTRGLPDTEQDWRYVRVPAGTLVRVTLTAPEADHWLGRTVDRLLIARQFEKDLARSLDNIAELVVAGFTPEPA